MTVKDGKCDFCEIGTFLDFDSGLCVPCARFCAECNSLFTCAICLAPAQADGSGGCISCPEGNYIVDGRCEKCDKSCKTCFGPTGCTSCQEGEGKQRDVEESFCAACPKGAILHKGECHACPESCLSCKEFGVCETCEENFTVDKHGHCVSTLCGEGRFFNENDSKCEDCFEGCANCRSEKEEDCL